MTCPTLYSAHYLLACKTLEEKAENKHINKQKKPTKIQETLLELILPSSRKSIGIVIQGSFRKKILEVKSRSEVWQRRT